MFAHFPQSSFHNNLQIFLTSLTSFSSSGFSSFLTVELCGDDRSITETISLESSFSGAPSESVTVSFSLESSFSLATSESAPVSTSLESSLDLSGGLKISFSFESSFSLECGEDRSFSLSEDISR